MGLAQARPNKTVHRTSKDCANQVGYTCMHNHAVNYPVIVSLCTVGFSLLVGHSTARMNHHVSTYHSPPKNARRNSLHAWVVPYIFYKQSRVVQPRILTSCQYQRELSGYLREPHFTMNASERFVGESAIEDAAEGNVTESSRSPVTPLKCRASLSKVVLCAVMLCVALLLVCPLIVFYLPRDDQPSVRVYAVFQFIYYASLVLCESMPRCGSYAHFGVVNTHRISCCSTEHCTSIPLNIYLSLVIELALYVLILQKGITVFVLPCARMWCQISGRIQCISVASS